METNLIIHGDCIEEMKKPILFKPIKKDRKLFKGDVIYNYTKKLFIKRGKMKYSCSFMERFYAKSDTGGNSL